MTTHAVARDHPPAGTARRSAGVQIHKRQVRGGAPAVLDADRGSSRSEPRSGPGIGAGGVTGNYCRSPRDGDAVAMDPVNQRGELARSSTRDDTQPNDDSGMTTRA